MVFSHTSAFSSGPVRFVPERYAPRYEIRVNGIALGEDITQFVESVEWESADGIADMGKISLINPDLSLSGRKALQVGNEVSIFAGYDTLTHLGRFILARPERTFPESDIPRIVLKGYSIDRLMMDNEPVKKSAVKAAEKEIAKAGPKKKRRIRKNRPHKDSYIHEVVKAIATNYVDVLDVDDVTDSSGALVKKQSFLQKTGISDYDMIRGLANLTGYLMWTDADEDGKWTIHFKNPRTKGSFFQEKKYTFRYNEGEKTTLFGFFSELALKDTRTKLFAEVRNPDTGKTLSVTAEDKADEDEDSDPAFTGDATAEIAESLTPGVRLYFGEYSVEVSTTKRFKTSAELKEWALQWFRRNRENFVMTKFTVIGVESLRARQIHALAGLGVADDGDYYFTTVRHILSKDGGYRCEVNARKVF